MPVRLYRGLPIPATGDSALSNVPPQLALHSLSIGLPLSTTKLDLGESPAMAIFESRPFGQQQKSNMNRLVRKHPSLFGVPFLLIMVAASFGMITFTQTRYDVHDQKVKHVRFRYVPNSRLFKGYLIRK